MPTWVTTALSALVNFPSMVTALVNAWMQRDKENNSPEMQANEAARKRLALEQKFETDVDKGDLNQARIDDAHP